MFRSVYGDRVDYTVRPNFMLDVPIARLSVRYPSGMFTADWEFPKQASIKAVTLFKVNLVFS